jgi:glutamine amidotransferase
MKVLIINYGLGNLASVRRAFEECGADVLVSARPEDLGEAERIILPGVGAFPDGMANLHAAGWPVQIRQALQNNSVQLLGICLGMQLLAEQGEEGSLTPGLGLIRGTVRRLQSPSTERIPHVGWNEVHPTQPSTLLAGINAGTDFYFVHSYHFAATSQGSVLATTPYCGTFASVVREGNVWGTQFHPEKSSKPGFRLIRNFLAR